MTTTPTHRLPAAAGVALGLLFAAGALSACGDDAPPPAPPPATSTSAPAAPAGAASGEEERRREEDRRRYDQGTGTRPEPPRPEPTRPGPPRPTSSPTTPFNPANCPPGLYCGAPTP